MHKDIFGMHIISNIISPMIGFSIPRVSLRNGHFLPIHENFSFESFPLNNKSVLYLLYQGDIQI